MSDKRSKNMRIFLSFIGMLLLWQCFAMLLENDILVPYPYDVLKVMLTQIMQPSFYSIILHTLMRTLLGFSIAFLVALLFAFLAYFYKIFEDIVYPIILLTRSVPNISYIIIVLFWFSSQMSVIVISFLILFPTMYATLLSGLRLFPKHLQDVMRIYPASRKQELRTIFIPYLRPHMFAASTAGISLAIKVGIMAEILGQVSLGIGRQLNICRANLDMAGVFAWTIWIILILYLIDIILSYLQKKSIFYS